MNQQVLDRVVKIIIEEFGEMEITRGSEHDFLGMKLKIDKSKKTIHIDMRKQINEVVKKFEINSGELVDPNTKTPAAHNLFKVDENAEQLNHERSVLFHTVTAKLLS